MLGVCWIWNFAQRAGLLSIVGLVGFFNGNSFNVNVCCFAVDMQALTERRLKLEEVRKTNSGFNALGDQE